MDTAVLTAIIGSVSTTVAAVSAWNSWRSARASLAALEETRRQRTIDNARSDLLNIGHIYDEATAFIETLNRSYRSDRAAVERSRESLRRSLMIAGIPLSSAHYLLEANEPLPADRVEEVRSELNAISASFHTRLRGLRPG
jgi:hypothetical protein